jgi:hypothetical protein
MNLSRKLAAAAVAACATALTFASAGPASAAESGVVIADIEGFDAVSIDGGYRAASGNLYGAMAISRGSGRVASAVNYASSGAADNGARVKCGAPDCDVVVHFANACGAVAQGADSRLGWSWAGTRGEAETNAVNALGMSAPPFPDLGSASPRPAHVVLSACTDNAN